MKKSLSVFLALLLLLQCVPAAATPILGMYAQAPYVPALYHMDPAGSDTTGDGTLAHPWLSPNHAGLTCTDMILAAPGTYPNMTITTTPTCDHHARVLVGCAVFNRCKVLDAQTQGGVLVQASFWEFRGWEVSTPRGPNSSTVAACFHATPTDYHHPIHDIVFSNDIANGCTANGFSADNGVDYFAVVASMGYNAAQGDAYCFSAFNVYQPIASDNLPGTHIYFAQDFAWHNLDPSPCQGFQRATDGEGFTFDTFNAEQSYNGGATPQYPVYAQQAVMHDLIAIYNGAAGAGSFGSGNRLAHMFFSNITATRNFRDTNQITDFCGQIQSIGYPTSFYYNKNAFTTFSNNLAVADAATQPGCEVPAYAYMEGNVDSTSLAYGNAGFTPSGQNFGYSGLLSGFQEGPSNRFGVDPQFPNPVEPPAPNCTSLGATSVIDCMTKMGVIAGFKPGVPALQSYGYQLPKLTPVYDPTFPRWLCDLPVGLVTMGCLDAPPPVRAVSTGVPVAAITAPVVVPPAAPLPLVLPAQFFTAAHPYNQMVTQYPDETRSFAAGIDGTSQVVPIADTIVANYGNQYLKIDATIPFNVVDSGLHPELLTSVLATHDYLNPRTAMVPAPDAYTAQNEPVLGATQESPASDVYGDNHVLVFDVRTRKLAELWHANFASNGSVSAASQFDFDVDSLSIPPLGQDTVEAAGSSVLAWTLRWAQLSQPIHNAMRLAVPALHGSQGTTLSARTYPADHAVGQGPGSGGTPLYSGQRMRLDPAKRPDLFTPAKLASMSTQTRNYVIALRDYGTVNADIGSDFYQTVDNDPAWAAWYDQEFKPLLLQIKNFTPVNSGDITDLNGTVLTVQ